MGFVLCCCGLNYVGGGFLELCGVLSVNSKLKNFFLGAFLGLWVLCFSLCHKKSHKGLYLVYFLFVSSKFIVGFMGAGGVFSKSLFGAYL